MSAYSKKWLETLPSITRFWFLSCLSTSILITIPSISPSINQWINQSVKDTIFQSLIDWLAMIFHGSLYNLDWNLIFAGQIWRIFSPFIIIGAFVPGLFLFTVLNLTFIGVYIRELEEHFYYDTARGAARLTSVLLFGGGMLLAFDRLVNQPTNQSMPFLAMPLIFFAITHLTLADPWERLGESNVFQRWHLPYLLLVPIALTATPMVGQAFVGILIGYCHHIATIRVKERFNISLWVEEPSVLVRIYQYFNVGKPKIGYLSTRGYSIAPENENEDHEQ